MMVEAGANEVPEMEMLDAILFAHEEIKDRRIYRRSGQRSRPSEAGVVTLYKPLKRSTRLSELRRA